MEKQGKKETWEKSGEDEMQRLQLVRNDVYVRTLHITHILVFISFESQNYSLN